MPEPPDRRTVLDAVDAAIFVLGMDPDDQPVYCKVNRIWIERSGRKIADVLGRTAVEVFPGPGGREAFDHHMACKQSGEGRQYEILLPLNGVGRLVHTRLLPVFDDTGRVSHVVGCAYDVVYEQERRSGGGQGGADFVAIAAHDLRAPMRQVRNLVRILKQDLQGTPYEHHEVIEMLEDLSTSAGALIGDVLDFAAAARSIPRSDTFSLDDLCDEIVAALDPGVQHRIVYPRMRLDADRVAVQILVRNLIDNALKHGGREQMTVTVTVAEAHHGWLEILVADDGAGFVDPGKVFDDDGRSRRASGFGLMSVRQLLKARGGEIEALPAGPEGGARVRVGLPGKVVATS